MELRDGPLLLRPWREEDADAVFEACQDPEIPRWMPMIPRPYTLEDARAFVTGERDLGASNLAIVEDGRVVGSVGMRMDRRENGEVGFQHEGVLRSHLLHPDGRRRDSVMYSLLPGELIDSPSAGPGCT